MTEVIKEAVAASPDLIQRGYASLSQAAQTNPIAAGCIMVATGVTVLALRPRVRRFAGTCAHTITDRITAMVRVAIDPTLVRRVDEIRHATPLADAA